jgi:hypothetical protein
MLGGILLDHIDIVGGVLVYKRRFFGSRIVVGDPVTLRTTTAGKSMYVIQGHAYRAEFLTRAVRDQDPAWVDNAYTKEASERGSLTGRDLEIFAALKAGGVYADIGAKYGVSRQRIKQIADKLASHGMVVSSKAERVAARAAAYAAATVSRLGASHEEVSNNPETLRRLMRRITSKRHAARQRGVEFSLTVSDIYPLPERCPVLDIPLNYDNTNGPADNALSIDRIDPNRGYVSGNVVLVSQRVNRIKNDATVDELRKIAEFYAALEVGRSGH